jgi:hypothetical protein
MPYYTHIGFADVRLMVYRLTRPTVSGDTPDVALGPVLGISIFSIALFAHRIQILAKYSTRTASDKIHRPGLFSEAAEAMYARSLTQ